MAQLSIISQDFIKDLTGEKINSEKIKITYNNKDFIFDVEKPEYKIDDKEFKSGIMEVKLYDNDIITKKTKITKKKKMVKVILNPSRERVINTHAKFFVHKKTKDVYWWESNEENVDHRHVWDMFFRGNEFGEVWDQFFYKGLWEFSSQAWGLLYIGEHGKAYRDKNGELCQDFILLPEVNEEIRNFYNIRYKENKDW